MKCIACFQSTLSPRFDWCHQRKSCYTGCQNGSGLFSAFLAVSWYSTLTLIQSVWRFEVVPSTLLRPLKSHLWSQVVDPLLAQTESTHLAYSQMVYGSVPSQCVSLSWLESNAPSLLKAEIGDHAQARRKKVLAQSLSKSLLMFETCQKSQCSLISSIIPVWLWMQPLYLLTWKQCHFPLWQTEFVEQVEYVTQ